MSHGHSHGDYGGTRQVEGLEVVCDGGAPKSGSDPQLASRVLCISRARDEACDRCEHRRFTIRFPQKIGDQAVACPRWDSIEDKLKKKRPKYEMIRREVCISKAPYNYCCQCPNQKATEMPKTKKGWWEEDHEWKTPA